MNSFVAIDFETATSYRESACAVGIVNVENGEIVNEFYSLIQPPDNEYSWHNISVHGIRPHETESAPTFYHVFQKILPLLWEKKIIAHNAPFDRSVLKGCMKMFQLDYDELYNKENWECTLSIYRKKGFKPANLAACCQKMQIDLNHHEALSDARACAKLYLMK